MMQIAVAEQPSVSSDFEQIAEWLPVTSGRLLELGCGAAFTTRRLAEAYPNCEIVAMEVDRIQHEKNLLIPDLPNVTFEYGGAEAINLPDDAVDAVIMLKSLHHVPIESMPTALQEIARVLRPGGLAYISEPVYAGEFNAIMRLFNDEKQVREAAFAALLQAVDQDVLQLVREIHFMSVSRFDGFAEFDRRILGATHSSYSLDAALRAEVETRFMQHVDAEGMAQFLVPMRVDLLRKAS